MKSLVSIVIPTFNRADIVGETVLSLLAQTYPYWEAIFVDDRSQDETVAEILKYSKEDGRIKVIVRPPDSVKGANTCRNIGFENSRGKYIKWFDSDDVLVSNGLMWQLERLESDDRLSVSLGQAVFFDHFSGALQENWSRNLTSDNLMWDYVRNNIRWHVGGVLWRRSFFQSPPFQEGLRNSQEWLMHGLQLFKLTPSTMVIIPQTICLVRRGNNRMSSPDSRTSIYFFNQAKARMFFLFESFRHKQGFRLRMELMKQVCIFLFHSCVRAIRR